MTEDSVKEIVYIDGELAEIVPDYLENRRKDVVALSAMLEREDVAAMRVLGHRMKGSGAGYGLDAISTIGGQVEQAAKEMSRTEMAAAIAALDAFLVRLEVVYT